MSKTINNLAEVLLELDAVHGNKTPSRVNNLVRIKIDNQGSQPVTNYQNYKTRIHGH